MWPMSAGRRPFWWGTFSVVLLWEVASRISAGGGQHLSARILLMSGWGGSGAGRGGYLGIGFV